MSRFEFFAGSLWGNPVGAAGTGRVFVPHSTMVDRVFCVEHKDPQRAIEGMKERLGEEGFKKAKALIGEPLEQKILNWPKASLESEDEMDRREKNIAVNLLIFFDLILVILSRLILKFRLPPGTGGGTGGSMD